MVEWILIDKLNAKRVSRYFISCKTSRNILYTYEKHKHTHKNSWKIFENIWKQTEISLRHEQKPSKDSKNYNKTHKNLQVV